MDNLVGAIVNAQGYGPCVVKQQEQFGSLILVDLGNGEQAWTDARLVEVLDVGDNQE